MAKHVYIDWVSVVGSRLTAQVLQYLNQVAQRATELISKRIALDTETQRDRAGIFLKPGILTSILWDTTGPSSNDLGIEYNSATEELTVYPGKAVTYKGNVIEIDSRVTVSISTSTVVDKTVFLVYRELDSTETDAQVTNPVTGVVSVPVKQKSFTVEFLDYDTAGPPSSDEYLDKLNTWGSDAQGNYVPLGKIDSSYNVVYDGGYRRIAIVNIPWLGFVDKQGWGHWDGEFSANVDRPDNTLFNWLASKGSQDRTTTNPFGLTPEDIGFENIHLYISHTAGFSEWPASSLQIVISGGDTFDISQITTDEWVYFPTHDNYMVATHSDWPSTVTYTVTGTGGHYYLVRIRNVSGTLTIEEIDLGTSESAAINALRSYFTQRHKDWIALAVYYNTGLGGGLISVDNSKFTDDFWPKDSFGNYIWNFWRGFHATTTSSSCIVHDGKATTPSLAVANTWYSPNSKLLRDIIDYIIDTMSGFVTESDLLAHKQNKHGTQIPLPDSSLDEHWADSVVMDSNTWPWPIVPSDSDKTVAFSEYLLRLIRRDRRQDNLYSDEDPGFKVGITAPYLSWASSIKTDDSMDNEQNLEKILLKFYNDNVLTNGYVHRTYTSTRDSFPTPGVNINMVDWFVVEMPNHEHVAIIVTEGYENSDNIYLNINVWIRSYGDLESFDFTSSPDGSGTVTLWSITGVTEVLAIPCSNAVSIQSSTSSSKVFVYIPSALYIKTSGSNIVSHAVVGIEIDDYDTGSPTFDFSGPGVKQSTYTETASGITIPMKPISIAISSSQLCAVYSHIQASNEVLAVDLYDINLSDGTTTYVSGYPKYPITISGTPLSHVVDVSYDTETSKFYAVGGLDDNATYSITGSPTLVYYNVNDDLIKGQVDSIYNDPLDIVLPYEQIWTLITPSSRSVYEGFVYGTAYPTSNVVFGSCSADVSGSIKYISYNVWNLQIYVESTSLRMIDNDRRLLGEKALFPYPKSKCSIPNSSANIVGWGVQVAPGVGPLICEWNGDEKVFPAYGVSWQSGNSTYSNIEKVKLVSVSRDNSGSTDALRFEVWRFKRSDW